MESRLRIFWKFALLPVCSVASFCWKSRGSRKFYLLLQFLRYRHAVCGIIRTTKLATNCRKRNFEFLPQKFFRAFQSQKIFFKNFFWLWTAVKNFWGDRFFLKRELWKTEAEISNINFFRKSLKIAVNPELRVTMS